MTDPIARDSTDAESDAISADYMDRSLTDMAIASAMLDRIEGRVD